MGKEWLYWVGGGGGGGGGASNTAKKRKSKECKEMEEAVAAPGCMCAVFNFLDLHHLPFTTLPQQTRPSLSPDTIDDDDDTLLQDKPSARKGLEAPRNSLEMNEKIKESAASSSSTMKFDENLNIPVGIRIRTNGRAKTEDIITSSECISSPGTKPPNLVARLMGLDLLPESGSPSSLSRQSISPSLLSRQYLYSHDVSGGTVSLPETPRMSLARKSDVVDHHRLSLQSLKENIIEDRLDVSILGGSISPAHYARRIVKQVKDRVSRKVGADITNTIGNRDDDHLLVLNPNKRSALLRKKVKEDSGSSNQSTPSCSPRLSFLDSKKKSVVVVSKTEPQEKKKPNRMSIRSIKPQQQQQQVSDAIRNKKEEPFIPMSISSIRPQAQQQQQQVSDAIHNKKEEPFIRMSIRSMQPQQQVSDAICNKKEEPFIRSIKPQAQQQQQQVSDAIHNKKEEPFIRSIKPQAQQQQQQVSEAIRNKKEEPFIRSIVSDKKYPSKKTSPSKELLNISVPTLVPKRKDLSLPITQFHDKQLTEESDAPSMKRSTQLPSCLNRSYKQEKLATLMFPFQENIQTKCTSNNNSFEESEHYGYIQRILKRIGIDKTTPVSLAKWYSQSHPLDPSIFHYLELFHPTMLSGLPLYGPGQRKLVFDLVDELLVEILKPSITKRVSICGSELIDILCKKVGEFPGANCQVLEDIDALINMDFQRLQVGKMCSLEDLEMIAVEIEHKIVDNLMDETIMILYCSNFIGYSSRTY